MEFARELGPVVIFRLIAKSARGTKKRSQVAKGINVKLVARNQVPVTVGWVRNFEGDLARPWGCPKVQAAVEYLDIEAQYEALRRMHEQGYGAAA